VTKPKEFTRLMKALDRLATLLEELIDPKPDFRTKTDPTGKTFVPYGNVKAKGHCGRIDL
jgi:hypothetical protein